VFSCSLVSPHCTQLCSAALLSLSTVRSCVQLLSCLSPLQTVVFSALLSLSTVHTCVQLLSCLSPLYPVVFSCSPVSLHCTQLCSAALLYISTLIHKNPILQYLLSLSVARTGAA
jgi:hypothetical protein